MIHSPLCTLAWLLALVSACSTTRNPNVCCSNDAECAQLGLPPGSANEYGCSQGFVCREFYCVTEESPDAAPPPADAAVDARVGNCNPSAPFGAPVKLANVNSGYEDLNMALRHDQLKAYFVQRTSPTVLSITSSKRDSVESDFPAPIVDPAFAAITSAPGDIFRIYIASNDLDFYYEKNGQIFVSSRPTTDATFSPPTKVLVDNVPLSAGYAKISADSLTLYWSTTTFPLKAASFAGASFFYVNNRVMTTFEVTDFAVSSDNLTLYYSNFPYADIFRTTRVSQNVPFDIGVPVANVSTTGPDIPLYVSPDDCFLYLRAFSAPSSNENDFWVARRGY